MVNDILDNSQLAERWKLVGTSEAIAKRFQRLRALPKSSPRHLKAFKVGNQTRYRLEDILDYEIRNSKTLVDSRRGSRRKRSGGHEPHTIESASQDQPSLLFTLQP